MGPLLKFSSPLIIAKYNLLNDLFFIFSNKKIYVQCPKFISPIFTTIRPPV